ncbi:FHA domain-containing protein [Dictyobacter formicarum]|uniref:ABC transporter ATP-binding protein n=1 Tax=Dictyobacter formicarum TaxID=2778368 RepID=A0ABQ3VF61_9CHLR|nr:FHA domain-containing protein [Dictyobacter formicarum]GHO84420.1 ABC transporter ATP-binding protein [Dictyobacter formicarum]
METLQKPFAEAAVRFLNGPLTGKVFFFQKPVVTLGREKQNDIIVPDLGISRYHVRMSWLGDAWRVENISQGNMLALNEQQATQAQLHHNDVIKLSSTVSFVFLLRYPETQQVPSAASTPNANYPVPPAPISQVPQPSSSQPSLKQTEIASSNNKSQWPGLAQIPNAPDSTVMAHISTGNVPSLLISSNTRSERQVAYLTQQVSNIGRDISNEIIIDTPIVSSWHAQIVREEDKLFLVHPHPRRGKTLNGLWYQGQHIRGDQVFRHQLQAGDIFRIGDEHGTLVTLTYDAGTEAPAENLPAMAPIVLQENTLTIGRTPDNMVVLNHPQVSAHHAIVEKVTGGYRLLDQNSTNHVYINGEQVSHKLLRTGDEIRIGPYRLTYTGTELRPYDESNHIRIEALHLKKAGNNNVILLNDISLVIPPRKFVALVGGSGAGKSTLMDALNGLRPAQEGVVLYNEVDYYRNLAAFNTQLGYVPQDDIVHRDLTVERALYYAAKLRLPGDFTKEQIAWRINEVLEDVEMTERRHLLVSKLSGGQRKRVSIALELLANPGVFFLDEPTSGLDPGLDRKMMALLRRLADRGRTIVLVTHATNNINTCDYVCFLAQGGRLAYFGPPNEAKTFFEKTDFSEIYSALEPTRDQPDIPQKAEERFLNSADYQRYIVEPLREQKVQSQPEGTTAQTPPRKKQRSKRRGQGWTQFMLLSARYLELLRNDVGNLFILLLQAPVIAIMLVLMVRFEVGAGVFDANKLTQCRTQILTSSGPLALPQAQRTELIDCQQVLHFLNTDANAKLFVQQKGSVAQALQSFLIQGPGTDAQKVLFIMAFATVLFGCINGAREIVKEAAIYRRERTVNLGILPYMFSKIVVLGLLCLFQSAILTLVVEIGEPLRQGVFLSPILETYITLCLTSLAGLMIGLTISAIAPNNDRAISLVPIILLPQVIFSGAIIPLKDWVTQIIATIFPTRWAMAALGSSIGLHADTTGGDKLFGDDPTYHSTLYSIYSQTDALHRLVLSWVGLGLITILLTIAIGIFLKRKDART